MKATLSISALLILTCSCNNTAPKTDITNTVDTTKKSDTSVLTMNDTAPVAIVTKTATPPPPPPKPRFLEIQAVDITDEDRDPPPIMDANVNPYSSDFGARGDYATGPIPEMDSKIYTVVDQMPEMPMLREFLFNNMIYPESALNAGIQGVSTIGFVVNENGVLENIKVVKSSGNNDLDKEAIRVIRKTTGRWKPGRINGKAVKTQMSLPITFQLDE